MKQQLTASFHDFAVSLRYYGYKVHCAVDTATGLPLAWEVKTARDPKIPMVSALLDSALERGFAAQVAALDRATTPKPSMRYSKAGTSGP
jgi:Transposase DDE domain